jgi:hypothetical protein
VIRYITSFVESITGGLASEYYREDEETRTVKRDLGLRRAAGQSDEAVAPPVVTKRNVRTAVRHLNRVSREATNPVLKSAAESFRAYLR